MVWHKVRKDGGSDGRGVGFYFRNVTELILFGVKGKNARTLSRRVGDRSICLQLASASTPASRMSSMLLSKGGALVPDLELFGRGTRKNWATWGDQADLSYRPTWATYRHHSQIEQELIR